ncbi:MAG: hypothetical protein JGK24_01220 [Microcoleus sp. PH2017_29_MFU_D_A]|uniref:DUF6887 family protein n=1 Tax=unclassified Microcoleus TaxID=2642155 RepID=UPI001D7C471F|nr:MULTISPECIES: hypothetical protein [unclassified Microcoleus]MCC3416622.1 hypothetical protein [Microcoleus sp. PH2017_07_MST_O_A]MCC3429473.1 hypothetical protein [Microcoleus sp. PH2017_04_SCI_O_A]MCC3442254.1 hypothetical protein [Microcoleus sp. PH2017_03_ELD_O_A]MCC3469194.1 hypothetical protein [Microcoleus sp. PH2017_06_SFM_O_A]MCC3503838.1 hypothetical protein [Microcoleus sp. PH2017_19_SFW_U_A]MCC3508398.1 hypothetical protein [Microcoleus sp. PH2017_17_BER_D_A]TAE12818.1 MAG: hy
MSQVDYTAMGDRELKRYFLKNRGDKAALQAYLDRRKERSNSIITKVGDPDFDTKIEAAIRQQMKEYKD